MPCQLFYHSVIIRPIDNNIEPLIDVDTQIKIFLTNFSKVDRFVFQLEKGASGNFHYQTFVHLCERLRARTLQKALLDDMPSTLDTIGVEPCSTSGISALRSYAMKTDTRVRGPYADVPIYLGADLVCMRDPLPWQQQVLDMIARPPCDRRIIWIRSFRGCVGKSKLCKWLCFKNQKSIKFIGVGTAIQLLSSAIATGPRRCYLCDLPKIPSKESPLRELISAVEQIKNGFVISSLYGRAAEMYLPPPHIFIFSNSDAPFRYFTSDRLVAFYIEDKFERLTRYYSPDIVTRLLQPQDDTDSS